MFLLTLNFELLDQIKQKLDDAILPVILYYGKKSMQNKLLEKKKACNQQTCHVSRSYL